MLWDELAVIHFLYNLQMALTATEFICLMMSALHPNASALFSALHFLDTDHLKSAEVKGCVYGMRSHHACCPMNHASLESLHMDGELVVCGCVPFASKTPSEVRTLTAAPSSPALASASAFFTGLKEPYLRATLGMFHSSLNTPFLNNQCSGGLYSQQSCLSCC